MRLLPGLLKLKEVKETAGEPTGPVNCFINSHLDIGDLLAELARRRNDGKPTDQIELELRLRDVIKPVKLV